VSATYGEIDSIKLREDVALTERRAARPARSGAPPRAIYKEAGAFHAAPWRATPPRRRDPLLRRDVGSTTPGCDRRQMWLERRDARTRSSTPPRPSPRRWIQGRAYAHPFPRFASGLTKMPQNRGRKLGITMIGARRAATLPTLTAYTASRRPSRRRWWRSAGRRAASVTD